MNLPFFLLKSLERMSAKFHLRKDNHISSMFHFSLIKIFVKFAMNKNKVYWSDFLSSINLVLQTESSSVKICEEEQEVRETHEKKVTLTLKETNIVEEKDAKSNKKPKGKLGN